MVSWSAITTILIPTPRRFIEPTNTTTITTTAVKPVIRTDAIRMTGTTQLLPEHSTAGPTLTGTKATIIITGTHGLGSPTIIGKTSGTVPGTTIEMKDDNAGRTIRMRMGNGNVSKIGISKKPGAKTEALKSVLRVGVGQGHKMAAAPPLRSKIVRRDNKETEGGAKGIRRLLKAANNSRSDSVPGVEKRIENNAGYSGRRITSDSGSGKIIRHFSDYTSVPDSAGFRASPPDPWPLRSGYNRRVPVPF